MPSRTILLNNGLVNSRSPSMLGDGELSEAINVEYLSNDPAVHKVAGHELFSTPANSGGCYGMFHMKFDNADPVLLVCTAYSLLGGPPRTIWGGYSDINNFAVNANIAISDEHRLTGPIDVINYLDKYYVLFGGNLAQSTGETRNFYIGADYSWNAVTSLPTFHGMKQNVSKPKFFNYDATGGYTLTGTETVQYWIEERVKDSLGNIIKRNSGSSATVLTVRAGTDIYPIIDRPDIVNADTTHWALYSTGVTSSYPVGFELAENTNVGGLDYKVYDTRTGTPAAPSGAAYKTLTAVLAGVALTVPRYGAMPRASFGDIFEDSLVTNDLDAPKYLAWSYTGDPHAFPSLYRLSMNSKEGDTVTMIRRLGGSLIVGMTDSVWRISTLPKFSDSSFDAERVKGQIEGAHGAISQRASCLYSSMENIRLAYVSSYGIRSTDGNSWFDSTADLDWAGTVGVDKLSSCFLVNNPSKYRIEFYYADNTVQKLTYDLGGSITFDYIPNKCLYLHYHPSHAKSNGGMKITGPHPIGATGGCVVYDGTTRSVWLATTRPDVLDISIVKTDVAESGVFIDGSGSRAIEMSAKSGEFYLAGPLGEANVREVVVNHTAGQSQQEASISMTTRSEGQSDLADTAQIPVESEGQSTADVANYGLGSSHKLGITNSDSLGTFGINYIAVDYDVPQPLGGFAKTD